MRVIVSVARLSLAASGMDVDMQQKASNAGFQNAVFIWIAFATAAVLLLPVVAMQFTPEVRWDKADFIVMGSLFFAAASLFVLAARRVERKRRVLVGMIFLAAFLYVWAELAVGLFTTFGA